MSGCRSASWFLMPRRSKAFPWKPCTKTYRWKLGPEPAAADDEPAGSIQLNVRRGTRAAAAAAVAATAAGLAGLAAAAGAAVAVAVAAAVLGLVAVVVVVPVLVGNDNRSARV